MPFKTLYLIDCCRIEADLEKKLLKAKWLRPMDEWEARQAGAKICQALYETQLNKLLIDSQDLRALPPEVKDWMSTSFFHSLSGTKLKKLARILPASAFGRVALKAATIRAEAMGEVNFIIRNFPSQDEAYHWLGYGELNRD